MSIKIKRTNKEEELIACAILFTNNDPWKKLGESFEYNNEKVHSSEEEVYVAMDGDKVIGCLLLEMHSTLKAFVRGLVVDNDYRGQGIGAQLLSFIEKRVFHELENIFIFCSSDRGRKFYKNNGYIEIGSVDNMNVSGTNETIFRKTIGPSHEVVHKELEVVVMDGKAKDFEEAINNAGEYLYSLGLVKEEYAIKCIEREKQYSTGLPTKIPCAIPHTDAQHCIKNALCFQRLESPVDVKEIGSENHVFCKLIINIAVGAPDSQVKVLSNLMNLVQDEEIVKICLEKDTNELQEILENKLMEL